MNHYPNDNIKIVMVNPSHPGNIGSAARVLKNMCLKRLFLVNPKQFPDGKAKAMASGANDILEQTSVTATLEDAISDCKLVIAASARKRYLSHQVLTPKQAAEMLLNEGKKYPVALLFGRESAGLTNEELSCCHYLVEIPTNPEHPSLNVASAIQIMTYEIWQYFLNHQADKKETLDNPDEALASVAEIEYFYEHFEQTMHQANYLNSEKSHQVMPYLRRIFNRIRLEAREVKLLRGILTAINKKIKE